MVLASQLGFRADSAGNSMNTAAALLRNGNSLSAFGIILSQDDDDFWTFSCDSGDIDIVVKPWTAPVNAPGGNLDVSIQLRRPNGNVIALSKPTESTDAQLLRLSLPVLRLSRCLW